METDMKNQKSEIRYPYMPEGRTILYVPKDNKFMMEAKKIAKEKSTDKHISTGAVIVNVKNNNIVSKDANIAPLTNKYLINLHKKYCIRRILRIPSGQKYWICPGCAGGSNHAEYRASKKLIKQGFDKNDKFDLYLWGHWWACKDCWNKMLEIPIRNVYLLEGSEIFFNEKDNRNIIGYQFD